MFPAFYLLSRILGKLFLSKVYNDFVQYDRFCLNFIFNNIKMREKKLTTN